MPIARVSVTALSLMAALSLVGCTGQDSKDPVSSGRSPEEVMELAKKTFDETSGVQIDLSGKLPDGVTGLTSASGIGTHQLGFEGSAGVTAFGVPISADVIALDDDVWIRLPGRDFQKMDPGQFGAPNPADLMATDGGLSDLLIKTEDLEKGDDVLGGENNEETLTAYTGTVPADVMESIIPSASGDDFEVSFSITADGELREASLTGQFYPDGDKMTYDVSVTDYGTDKEIKAP